MTLRGALIGCGFFALNHMKAWADLPDVQIVAVCDRDGDKAQHFARQFGAAPFTDAAQMLAEIRPDFTDIATTVTSHRALVELAARHSRMVICQKPFAATLADGRAMVAACETAGIPLLVHENFRWQAPARAMGEQITQGAIGRPQFLRLSFRHGFDIYANQPYLAEIEDLALTDVGLHLFDMARCLFGDVMRVHCETQRLHPRVVGQDAFLAQLRHDSGALSSVECSFYSHYAPDRFPQTLAVAEGDRGTLELREDYLLRLHRDGSVTEFPVEPPVPHWGEKPWHLVQDSVIAFQAHALAVLRDGAQPQPSGADNLKTLALTRAAIVAARTGCGIDLTTFRDAEDPATT